ncbi:anthrone oxygenase family protein [Crossiella sp. CA198]|uniref:anthrone oxygenase family protein n=1 Tax=Crossiella sp. CA198 TaxID=3455607 RepID=UPI003F8D7A34
MADPRVLRATSLLALLSGGLLAGAFGYGAVNVATTFNAVPLEVRLTFHSALMQMNGPVMQTTMAAAALSALALAVLCRGLPRVVGALAGLLVVGSFLVTRFGNVPINGQIKVWAVSGPPAGYAELLSQWETFNVVRTVAAVLAFALIGWLVVSRRSLTPTPG